MSWVAVWPLQTSWRHEPWTQTEQFTSYTALRVEVGDAVPVTVTRWAGDKLRERVEFDQPLPERWPG